MVGKDEDQQKKRYGDLMVKTSAHELAEKQRESSISQFFEKNRPKIIGYMSSHDV